MVKLSEIIGPSFFKVHQSIQNDEYTHYWLPGGRFGLKSSTVSIEIPLGIMNNPGTNGIALRKYSNTLYDSVFAQLKWGIEMLGATAYWKAMVSPLRLIYTPTGQEIIFRGADDPLKIKSIKAQQGYYKYIWYEELHEFTGMEDVRNINQSLMRGGDKFCVFYTYNPPPSVRNWVNQEALADWGNRRLVHHSTYLTVPKEWLGEQILIEAEHLKKTQPERYRHEYLGEITGTGGEVFANLIVHEIEDSQIESFDQIRQGIDFGYAVDPFVWGRMHYDKKRRRLYIFDEIYGTGLSNRKAAQLVQEKTGGRGTIIADSAEPKSIDEMRGYGLDVFGARKGPDSVDYGIKFLQDLEQIIIDPRRCPNTAREFMAYELERDRSGEFRNRFPDKNNHTIDMVRYALENDMRNKTAKVVNAADYGIW